MLTEAHRPAAHVAPRRVLGLLILLALTSSSHATDELDPRVLEDRVMTLRTQGRYAEAVVPARQFLAALLEAHGESHYQVQDVRNLVKTLQTAASLPDEDRDSLLQLDAGHKTAGDLLAAARLHDAVDAAREQYDGRARILGEDHPETLGWGNTLAMLTKHTGAIFKAEILLRSILERSERVLGSDHPGTIQTLNLLSHALHAQGHTQECEVLSREVVERRRRVLGEEDPNTLGAMQNLAMVLHYRGATDEAETLLRKCLTSYVELWGEDHDAVRTMRSNLARILLARGALDDAEAMFSRILESRRQRLGESNPITTQAKHALGEVYRDQGKTEEAERLFREALRDHRTAMGDAHDWTIRMLNTLADLVHAQGRFDEAETLWNESAEAFELARQALGPDFNKVQFASHHSPLASLAACLARNGKPVEAWNRLEANLGRGLLDAVDAADMQSRNPEAIKLATRKQTLLNALQDLSEGDGVEPDGRLETTRRELEADLAAVESQLVEACRVTTGGSYSLPRIQEQLESDTAIVAWLDKPSPRYASKPVDEHWACIVTHQGDPKWIPLPGTGPGGSRTARDNKRCHRVGQAIAQRPENRSTLQAELSALYTERFKPLRPHLHGIKKLVLLPAGWMNAIPLEALTDQYTLSYAPSATIFAWLKSNRGERATAPPPRLLAVADPDPTMSDVLPRLPGTRVEVKSIARLFESPAVSNKAPDELLMGGEATERKLEQLSRKGQLAEFDVIHLATHGVLDDRTPWQSALVLAHDPTPRDISGLLSGGPIHDGRLTAEQVLRTWKLQANLVTLSGCQTGLGKAHEGEGYLGFSQALFVSGARSLLVTLWKVDDKAAALVTHRFYENWLGRHETPRRVAGRTFATGQAMPKAEALREAKDWLRRRTPEQNRLALASMGFDMDPKRLAVAVRGGIHISKERPRVTFDYSDPHFWAGFILIGDPE